MEELKVEFEHMPGVGCPRCRKWHPMELNHHGLCDNCCTVILAEHPDHPSVPFIREAYRLQREKFGVK
jgi:hypothetical protein